MKPNTDKKINFYHRIIITIQATNKLPSDLTPQRARYYTKPLIDSKLIEYRGSGATGAWFLTETFKRLDRQGMIKKRNLITLVKPNTSTRIKNVRGHGFGIRMKIPKIANWNNRMEVLKVHGYDPKLLKTGAVQIILKGNKTHLCNSSIVMHFDSDYSYVAATALESTTRAINDFLKLLSPLESKFKISFKIKGQYKIKCFRHHFGHLDNTIAKKCKTEGKTYIIRRDNGEEWLRIDFSNKSFVEAETTNDETGIYDMDAKIKPFFDELDKNPHFISTIKDDVDKISKNLLQSSEIQNKTQEELMSLTFLVKKLSEVIEKKL